MVQIDETKSATIGDKIKFNLSNHSYEGIVTYDFNRNIMVVTESLGFNFKDIDDWELIEAGPFHNVGKEPSWQYSSEYFSDKDVSDTSINESSDTESGPFSYRFGESACEVFERWSAQLNILDKKLKSLKKKAKNG